MAREIANSRATLDNIALLFHSIPYTYSRLDEPKFWRLLRLKIRDQILLSGSYFIELGTNSSKPLHQARRYSDKVIMSGLISNNVFSNVVPWEDTP